MLLDKEEVGDHFDCEDCELALRCRPPATTFGFSLFWRVSAVVEEEEIEAVAAFTDTAAATVAAAAASSAAISLRTPTCILARSAAALL